MISGISTVNLKGESYMNDLINYFESKNELDFSYEISVPNDILLEVENKSDFQSTSNSEKSAEYDEIDEIKFDDTVHDADKWDYIIAASSGVITGAIDILWVGEFSLTEAQSWGRKEIEDLVLKVARSKGYRGNDLAGAIRKLEKDYKIPSDKLTPDFGGPLQHHLRDFSHHPTIIGLLFSILTQFTGMGFGTDTEGNFIYKKIPVDESIGGNFPEKIFNGIVIWVFHLISDMAGSNQYAGKGTGIPGPLLSFLKEMSVLPIIKELKLEYKDDDRELSVMLSKLFNGTFFAGKNGAENVRIDLRTEIGIIHELSKQTIPIIVNECIVRSIYPIRRVYLECKNKDVHTIQGLKKIEPKNFLPYNNKALTRMITVSSGVFMVIESSTAAVRAVIKSRGSGGAFIQHFALNINYFGIGRFAFACVADAKYISEDFKKINLNFINNYKSKGNKDNIDNDIPDAEYLILNECQSKILYSLKLQEILYDIHLELKDKHIILKKAWVKEWQAVTIDSFKADDNFFIKDEESIYDLIREELMDNLDSSWLFLVAMELDLFVPYYPLSADYDKELKKLTINDTYEKDQFCRKQNVVNNKDIESMSDLYRKYKGSLSNRTQKIISGAAFTAIATVATGGLAWAFAPQVAILLAGGSVAGLSGAALTSASLAAIGGGSLAASGLGMAGGMAIVTGGGALLGGIGSGVASISKAMIITSKDYTMNECAKLLTYCKYVLIDQYGRNDVVKQIQKQYEKNIDEVKREIEDKENEPEYNERPQRKKIRESRISLKYLNRCNSLLIKMTE